MARSWVEGLNATEWSAVGRQKQCSLSFRSPASGMLALFAMADVLLVHLQDDPDLRNHHLV
jgi:hypothetical protein